MALGVFPDNERAIAVYEHAGFVREGLRRRQYRMPGGEYRDELLMAWFPDGGRTDDDRGTDSSVPSASTRGPTSRSGASGGAPTTCIGPMTRTRAPKHYLLTMYPYPSGDLHIGHWYAATGPDIVARMRRMQGLNVMFPMGFDSFGLPAENAAIDRGVHPAVWTERATSSGCGPSSARMGCMFDWSREVVTSDPAYYRWTQWLFLQFFKAGLAYRAMAPVDWCPKDQVVLAREQVEGVNARLLALRDAGHQARPGAVVLPDHPLRGRAARLHARSTGRSRSA